jgi:hypothetical protein
MPGYACQFVVKKRTSPRYESIQELYFDFGGSYSGSGLPLVSGAKGRVARPTRKMRDIVTPA